MQCCLFGDRFLSWALAYGSERNCSLRGGENNPGHDNSICSGYGLFNREIKV